MSDDPRRTCPDGGRCHHHCTVGCWRTETCGPLSNVYPDDEWPASLADLPESDGHL